MWKMAGGLKEEVRLDRERTKETVTGWQVVV